MNASTYRSAKIENRTAVLEDGLLTVFQGGDIIAEHRVDGLTPGQVWALVNAPLPVAEDAETVDMPGALADFLADTNMMTGAEDADATSKAARLAYEGGQVIRRGKGYTLRLKASKAVLRVFSEYAETILSCAGEWTSGERSAAKVWLARVA